MANTVKSEKGVKGSKQGSKGVVKTGKNPKSSLIARKGVSTSGDFANLMGVLMGDLLDGSVSPEVGQAACKAGSNLLKVVEMQYKYGGFTAINEKKQLILT